METLPSSTQGPHSNNFDEELKSPPKTPKNKLSSEELKKQAKKRSQSQPIINRVMKAFKRGNKNFRELIINAEPLEKRVALLIDGVLDKFEVERTGENRMVGAIFKGKIQNLEPGLKAAFVDIGQAKNAFLHYWDILPPSNDASIEYIRDNKSSKKQNADKVSLKEIPNLYPIGTDIVVQITKAQIGTKGPRTTTNIAIPGRFLVLMPFSGQCGVSRKIEDPKERNRLKKIVRSLTLPEDMGVIVRTAGEGMKARYFIRDLHILLKKWEKIEKKMNESQEPVCLYQEPDIIERTVRDFLTEDIDRVLVDKDEDLRLMGDYVDQISPRSKNKISLFKENIPIFERFNIERQIEQTFQRTVSLPSGGEIVIEETEALTAVDVNTGSHRGSSKDGKDYILQANLEAASEVARQVRLRNIGGLIIIDFIDMKNRRDRNTVLSRMKQEMAKDKAKNHILPISQLGIMQMTRQRHKESMASGIYTHCPYCHGRGIVKSPRSISVEIQRRLVSVIRHTRANGDNKGETLKLEIMLHPTALERLKNEDEKHLIDIEAAYNVRLSFRSDPSFHVENFKIIDSTTSEELR